TTATRLSEQEYQMEMDYEALAAVEAEQAAKDAKQEAMRKIWEEQMHPLQLLPIQLLQIQLLQIHGNPTSANLNPGNPTSAKPTTAKPTPRTRSKRKKHDNPVVPRVFVKQRGRSERIAKMQGKNFKYDEKESDSTYDKAFPVSESESE
ncbi:hypothetical protein Tco_0082219, partial [Tanacetum coccineum]